MFGSLLHLVSTFPSVVSINLLQVNICILFVTWPYKTTPVRCYAYLCVTAPRSMSPPWRVWWPKASDSKRKNASPKTWILNIHCHWRIELTGQPLREKKMSQPKNVRFGKKCLKIKKHIFPLMTTFYDFAFKTETSWANKDVIPSLETWNVNDVIVYMFGIFTLR